jgi:hypothetical protein
MLQNLIAKWNREDDDKFHFRVSVIKSGFRIVAGVLLIFGATSIAGISLIAAEVLGIVEEL